MQRHPFDIIRELGEKYKGKCALHPKRLFSELSEACENFSYREKEPFGIDALRFCGNCKQWTPIENQDDATEGEEQSSFENTGKTMYPRETWQKLLRKANELDLNKGGYCDARSGVINFWCGPENKPDDWTGEIEKHQLDYPRDYVGSVTPVWDEESDLILAFSIKSTNYAIKYAQEIDYLKKEPYENRKEDLTWVKAEFYKLWQATFPTMPKPKITAP